MRDAITLDFERTLAELSDYHQQADAEIAHLRQLMAESHVAVVLSDVGYFPLVAAKALGIPGIVFCSLNWADILQAYVHRYPALQDIIRDITRWYAASTVFLTPAPSMPMPNIRNIVAVGPVARGGAAANLTAVLGVSATMKCGLVSLGGLPYPLDFSRWPRVDGWVWLVTGVTSSDRPDVIPLSSVPLSYVDILVNADLLLTKPGYGSIAEAGCAGIPVACLPRPDWPETDALLTWLRQKVPVLMVAENDLQTGACLPVCADWRAGISKKPGVTAPSGVDEVVHYLQMYLMKSIE